MNIYGSGAVPRIMAALSINDGESSGTLVDRNMMLGKPKTVMRFRRRRVRVLAHW